MNKKKYFNTIAPTRIKQRKAKSYYWNDITNYCDYFIHEDISVLEIGCGTGELLNEIKAKNKVGIDFSELMIENAKRQFPNLDVRLMAAEEIQLEQKFDLIILSNLIGYLDDTQLVFEKLHSVCHANTKIIVTYYNFLWEPILKFGEWIGIKTKTPRQNWLSLGEINNLLFLSGFQVYRNSRSMIFPLYIPLISELMNNVLAKLPVLRLLSINNYTFAKALPKNSIEKELSVSIIVPARNESGNIQNLINRLPQLGSSTELIFVESGSTDDTWEKIKTGQDSSSANFKIQAIQIDEKGKAPAVRKGFDIATGDVL